MSTLIANRLNYGNFTRSNSTPLESPVLLQKMCRPLGVDVDPEQTHKSLPAQKNHKVLKENSKITSVLCYTLLGKPSPMKERPIPSNPENRPFDIPQLGQKGPTCFYYACNMIRKRIKSINTYNTTERDLEKKASQLRKSYTFISKQYDTEKIESKINKTSREVAKKDLWSIGVDKNGRFKKFLEQNKYENLSEFLNEEYEIISRDFLTNSLNIDPKGVYERYIEQHKDQTLPPFPLWEKLDLKARRIECLAHLIVAIYCYRLSVSGWHPDQGCDGFMKHLAIEGPLVVCGAGFQSVFSQAKQTADIEGEPHLVLSFAKRKRSGCRTRLCRDRC